ncbi:hypothetical protein POM88_046669 [Heracleum sosnowskyi]|uniref:Proton pump-interactor 1 n=1 Tax=Heracleum sosnowskyi TaxID=360622 RepID=A0AAD8H7D1_9APIA|nr:hypothetical protein POM88_046669 [Heracleum sosnowskyi]
MGGLKGLEGHVGLSLHQNLQQQVSGGTVNDWKGNDNVCDDVGGSYVFVGEVNACDPVGDVDVENGGVVVGTGGNDSGLLAETGKGGALHGELLVQSGSVGVVEGGEVDWEVKVEDQVGLKDESGVGVQDGEVVVGVGGNDFEVKVEDQVCEKDESGAGVENGEVVVGVGGNEQDYTMEEDNCGLLVMKEKDVALHGEFLVETGTIGVVEDGRHEDQIDFESTTKPIENQESQTDTDGQLGERQKEVIEVMLAGESSENSFKSVEQNVFLSSADLGENKKSEVVVLGADGCELAKVEGETEIDFGEVQLNQTEIKLVEECLEHKISVTCSVDCVAHEIGEDQTNLKQINDLANDAELGEIKETEFKSAEASELSDILVKAAQQDVIVSPADFRQKSDTSVNVVPDSQIPNGVAENSWKADCTKNSVGSESYADTNLEFGVQYHSDMPVKDATVAEFKVSSGSVIGTPVALLECSGGDSVNGQTLAAVEKAKPFQFFIKIPRFDDDKLREQIKDAQLLVEEKTTRRDDLRIEIEMKRAKLQSIYDQFQATKSDERAARRSVKLKRQEIDFIQDGINKMKNLISVTDINNRIAHMEYMIEHETNPLEEEKQLLREINIFRKLRDQISSNVYFENEDNSAFSQIEHMERQHKALKKELGDLKAKVSNAVAAVTLLGQECNGEGKKLKELQAQFRAANDVRQDAYKDFLGLKRQLQEKSKHYWMYKDEAKAASDCALNGDREALYRLCTNQVETFMDLWNKDDEFREDYVRCNLKSTSRRLKTSDVRSLGSDEEVPIIPIYVGKREDMQLSSPSRTTHPSPATNLKQENTVKPVKSERVDGESWLVEEPRKKMLKDKTSVKPIPETGSVLHIDSGHLESLETLDEKKQQTEEELELAGKAEMLRQEEKEKLRQEERVKAQEALERKRRNAEKAQMRAMVRAQKEAEEREREREKRLRKKEKKNVDGETGLELQTNSTMEENSDSPGTKLKRSSQCNKYSKPKAAAVPPALRNRGRRQVLKEILCWILGAVGLLFLFMVLNGTSHRPMKPRTKGDRFSGNHWQPL